MVSEICSRADRQTDNYGRHWFRTGPPTGRRPFQVPLLRRVGCVDAVAAGTGVQYYFSPCLSLDRTTAVDSWVQTLRSVTHRTLHCWTSLFQTDILQLLSYSSQWVIGHSPPLDNHPAPYWTRVLPTFPLRGRQPPPPRKVVMSHCILNFALCLSSERFS